MQIEAETGQSPSLDFQEMAHFEELAKEWWNEQGKFRALHAFNPARIAFIVDEVARWNRDRGRTGTGVEGLTVLDVGCGGGILSEPLARLGANVTGIDPVAESIRAAAAHANAVGLAIDYRATSAECLVRENCAFDVLIASEVVEHVADLASFLKTCRTLSKPGALIVISTINRSVKSYGLVILAAEHALRLVPRGTHDWKKFIKPEELDASLNAAGFRRVRRSGIVFKPFAGSWELSAADLSVNYILSAEAV